MFLIGHRGAGAVEPENTVRALKKGMECAHFVEVDVRLTKDAVPVILHDPTVDRTTKGTGRVRDLPFSAVSELDAGKGERIPTLEEVLSLVKGKTGLIVELKEMEGIELILDLIRRSDIAPVFVVSFHAEALKEVKRTLHHARTGLIFAQPAGNPLEMAEVLHADMVLPRFSLLSAVMVEEAHRRRLMVIPWTLNREEEIRTAVELQVDGFATDDPCMAKKVLQEIASTGG